MKTFFKGAATIVAGSNLAAAKNLTTTEFPVDIPTLEVQSNQDKPTMFLETQLSAAVSQLATLEASPKAEVQSTKSSDATTTAVPERNSDSNSRIDFIDSLILDLNDLKTQNILRIGRGPEHMKRIILKSENHKKIFTGLGLDENDAKTIIEIGFTGSIRSKIYANLSKDSNEVDPAILDDKIVELLNLLQKKYEESKVTIRDLLGTNLTAEIIIIASIYGYTVCKRKTPEEKITDLRKEESAVNDKIKAKKVELKTEEAKAAAQAQSNTVPLMNTQQQQQVISTKKNELAELRNQKAALQDKIITAITKVSADKGLEEIRTQLLKIQKAIEKEKKKGAQVPGYLQTRETQLKLQKKEIDSMNESEEIAKLEDKYKKQIDINNTQNDTIKDRDNQIQKLTDTNKEQNTQIQKLTKEKDTIIKEKAVDALTITKLQEENTNLKKPQQTQLKSRILASGSRSVRSSSDRRSTQSSLANSSPMFKV
jgi:hypothetical protein